MGVLDQLGYVVQPANPVQRVIQRVAATRLASWVFQRTLWAIDRPLYRWSKGRITVPGLVTGLPVVLLTSTGAKTGKPRTMPLLGVPIDDDLAVIGSNFGTEKTPAWVHNLEADPAASVQWRETTVDVRARRADADETDRVFTIGESFYVGFPAYRERAAHRDIRVFVLEPAG